MHKYQLKSAELSLVDCFLFVYGIIHKMKLKLLWVGNYVEIQLIGNISKTFSRVVSLSCELQNTSMLFPEPVILLVSTNDPFRWTWLTKAHGKRL